MDNTLIWIGIAFCISQSAIFSGLNLAFFSLTRLRLEIEAEAEHSERATRVLAMRKDSNFLLTTILWGNVGINVLLTLLSESVMAGLVSFSFSTVIITLFGEIFPQAYFSRHALKMAAFLSPVLKFYQILLYPLAKPCALVLDKWLGKESAQFLTEENIMMFLKKHIDAVESEIEHTEGTGAINFLTLDDRKIWEEGEEINPKSIITLNSVDGNIIFPEYESNTKDEFLNILNLSEEKWVIITDQHQQPRLILDVDGFIRSALLGYPAKEIQAFCHKPNVVTDETTDLGSALKMIRKGVVSTSEEPIDTDVLILWGAEHKRIITGADLFGRLLKGI